MISVFIAWTSLDIPVSSLPPPFLSTCHLPLCVTCPHLLLLFSVKFCHSLPSPLAFLPFSASPLVKSCSSTLALPLHSNSVLPSTLTFFKLSLHSSHSEGLQNAASNALPFKYASILPTYLCRCSELAMAHMVIGAEITRSYINICPPFLLPSLHCPSVWNRIPILYYRDNANCHAAAIPCEGLC